MKDSDRPLDRLLRAAAATDSQPNEMPLGFDTRVLADWRAGVKSDFVEVGHFLRRVVFLSLAVIAFAGAGVCDELRQSEDPEPFLDQYAIADSAISDAVEP